MPPTPTPARRRSSLLNCRDSSIVTMPAGASARIMARCGAGVWSSLTTSFSDRQRSPRPAPEATSPELDGAQPCRPRGGLPAPDDRPQTTTEQASHGFPSSSPAAAERRRQIKAPVVHAEALVDDRRRPRAARSSPATSRRIKRTPAQGGRAIRARCPSANRSPSRRSRARPRRQRPRRGRQPRPLRRRPRPRRSRRRPRQRHRPNRGRRPRRRRGPAGR